MNFHLFRVIGRLMLLLMLTIAQAGIFAQSNTPSTYDLYHQEGLRFHEKGNYAEAVIYYDMAIEADPACIKCLYNRGLALIQLEKYHKALFDFDRILQLDPIDVGAYEQRGHLRYLTGDALGAAADFSMAVKSRPSAVAYTNRGMAYLNAQQYVEAIRDLENAVRLDPDDGAAHRALGDAFFAAGDYDSALPYYDTVLRLDPTDIVALNNRGNTYMKMGLTGQALADYNKSITTLPNSLTYTNRAKYWLQQGDFEKALDDSRAASQLDAKSPEAYYCVGLVENARGNHSIAADNFNKALSLDDQQHAYYNGRGLALFQLREYEDALSDFENAVALHPADAAAKERIADCRRQIQQGVAVHTTKEEQPGEFTDKGSPLVEYTILATSPDTKSALSEKVEGAPQERLYDRGGTFRQSNMSPSTTSLADQALQLQEMGTYLLTEKAYEKAIEKFDQAIHANPQLAASYKGRATCWAQTGQPQKALADWAQYLALNPTDADAYNERGQLRIRTGNVFGAEEDYNTGLALQPLHSGLLANRGKWYVSQGKSKAAIADFTKVLEAHPHHAGIYHQRGMAWFELKDYQQAAQDAGRAIGASNVERYEYYFLRAKAQRRLRRLVDALGNLEKTISLSPGFIEAYLHRAVVKGQMGDQSGACRDYEKALSLGYIPTAGSKWNQICKK